MSGEYSLQWTELEKALGGRPLLSGNIEEIKEQYNGLLSMLASMIPPPDPSVTARDEKINDDITVRIYHPKEARIDGQKLLPVCVYSHGGGYCCGNLDSEDPLCRTIAQLTPCIVVSVDYRLGPKYKMPTMIHDCVAAYKWAWQAAEQLGADQHKYFSAGGSAGGGLAFSVAENIIANGNADHIQGIVALVPVTLHYSNIPGDLKSMYKSYGENAVGVPIIDKHTMKTFFDSIDPDIADPAQFPALSRSLTQYPPTYIATCEFDPLRDDGKVMEHVLKEAGVKVKSDYYEGYPHYFWIFPSIHDGQKFVQNMIAGIHFVLGA